MSSPNRVLLVFFFYFYSLGNSFAFDLQCANKNRDPRSYCPVSGEDFLYLTPETTPRKVRGITIAPIEDLRLGSVGYGSSRMEETQAEIAHLGANWISLTPFGRMDNLHCADILPDFEIPVETNETLIRKSAEMAQRKGLRVAIIPHIYVMSGEWRGEIDMGNAENFDAWFANYEVFVLRFARLAEEVGAEMLSLGVEFKSTTNFHLDRWRQLIAKVRSSYSGALTYSANWDEVEFVEFWNLLDFIGINAFWPLTSKPGDGYGEMLSNARKIASFLEGISLYWDRPVVFTEFGVKSATDSALAPWEWPEHCGDLRYDEAYQAAAYRAVFEAMGPRPWFAGLFIWKYFSDPYDETQEKATGFCPRGKMAESVLFEWFQMPWDEMLTAPSF